MHSAALPPARSRPATPLSVRPHGPSFPECIVGFHRLRFAIRLAAAAADRQASQSFPAGSLGEIVTRDGLIMHLAILSRYDTVRAHHRQRSYPLPCKVICTAMTRRRQV